MPANLGWTNATGNGLADTAANWRNLDTQQTSVLPPQQNDNLFFDGTLSNANLTNLHGFNLPESVADFAGIQFVNGYSGTVTIAPDATAGIATNSYTMNSGVLVQPGPNTNLSVLGNFNWTGGTLNSSANLANVTLSGVSALIAPTGGSLTLGSNLTLTAGATGTLQGELKMTSGVELINGGHVLNVDSQIKPLDVAPDPKPVVRNIGVWDVVAGESLEFSNAAFSNLGIINLLSLNGLASSVKLSDGSTGTQAGIINLAVGTTFNVNGSDLKLVTGGKVQGEGDLVLGVQGRLRIDNGQTGEVDRLLTTVAPPVIPGEAANSTLAVTNPNGAIPAATLRINRHFGWNEGDIIGLAITVGKDATVIAEGGMKRTLNQSNLVVEGIGTFENIITLSNNATLVANGIEGKGEVTFRQTTNLKRPQLEANYPIGVVAQNGGKITVAVPVPGLPGSPVSDVPWYNLGGTVLFNNNTVLHSGYYQNGGTTSLNQNITVLGRTKDGIGGYLTLDAVLVAGGDFIIGNQETLWLVQDDVMKGIRFKPFSRLITGEVGVIKGSLINEGGTILVGGDGTIGGLTVWGIFDQTSGTLQMDILGIFFDSITVKQEMYLSGNFKVAGDPQLPPQSGRVYRFLTSKPNPPQGQPSCIGEFASVTTVPPLIANLSPFYGRDYFEVVIDNLT